MIGDSNADRAPECVLLRSRGGTRKGPNVGIGGERSPRGWCDQERIAAKIPKAGDLRVRLGRAEMLCERYRVGTHLR